MYANASAKWAAVGEELVRVMGSLPIGQDGVEDFQVHLAQAQRVRGQELARNFVTKVERYLPQAE